MDATEILKSNAAAAAARNGRALRLVCLGGMLGLALSLELLQLCTDGLRLACLSGVLSLEFLPGLFPWP